MLLHILSLNKQLRQAGGGFCMTKRKQEAFEPSRPFDHTHLMNAVEYLSDKYPFLGFGYLGRSILGRNIPLLTLGSGDKKVLYVGAHHGMEWITSMLLVRFVGDFCELIKTDKKAYRLSPSLLLRSYTLFIVPMLNPDGVEYQLHGIEKSNPLYERILRMNGGSHDLSHWQANARGVDLNHNYNAGFEEYKRLEKENGIPEGAPTRYSGTSPESEPETERLCNFIRFQKGLKGVLTLHTQGEEIFYKSQGVVPEKSERIARRMASLSGYRLNEAEGLASYGGLTDWCIQELTLPSFTIECGKGRNPLPLSDYFPIYTRLRELLFRFPILL